MILDKGNIKMSKYVILNCPTLMGNRLCYSKEIRQCADCTDCVMKQIVDYCLDNEKYGDEYYTRPILEKLDIQEIE